VRTCRSELLDRILIWNQAHLLHALREFETYYNEHRPHRTLHQAAPLRPAPEPIAEQARIIRLDNRRRDRLGGTCTSTNTQPDQHGRKIGTYNVAIILATGFYLLQYAIRATGDTDTQYTFDDTITRLVALAENAPLPGENGARESSEMQSKQADPN
jgi:hypothetical protein